MNKIILLVDDDYDLREYLRIILETDDFKTKQASNINEAEEQLKNNDIDLIILDVMMEKDSDGFNFAQKIKNNTNYKNIPIIMLTSVNQKTRFKFDLKTDGNFLPVNDFIEKPVSRDTLLARIKKLLK